MLFDKHLVNYFTKYYTIFSPVNVDSYVVRSAKAGKIWEKNIVDLFNTFVECGDVVIDVGAYIGSHSIALSNRVGASGTVILFEPCKQAFNCLIETQKYNKINNWLIYNKAVNNCKTVLDFTTNNDGGSFLTSYRPLKKHFNMTYSVETMTIDSLQLEECKFIKIDTEGAEWQVISGAHDTIEKCRPFIIIESFKSSKNHINLLNFCHTYNYNMKYLSSANYLLTPNTRNI